MAFSSVQQHHTCPRRIAATPLHSRRSMKQRSTMRFCAWVLLMVAISTVSAELMDTPTVRWTHTLEGAGSLSSERSLRKNNAVVAHRGGRLIFVTAADGSLHILDRNAIEKEPAARGSAVHRVFEPPAVSDASTQCRSGVTVVHREENSDYLVYAVQDVPRTSEPRIGDDGMLRPSFTESVSSRVFAVGLDGALLWSASVLGEVVGTPKIGQDGSTVYVSHNANNVFSQARESKGFVSVIQPTDGKGAEVVATLSSADRNIEFGPVEASIVQRRGKDAGTIDVVFVSEAGENGYLAGGARVYVLAPSASHANRGGKGDESYDFVQIGGRSFHAVARPTFNPATGSLFIGGQTSNVIGWIGSDGLLEALTEGIEGGIRSTWNARYQPSERNFTQPFLNSPVVSTFDELLFIPGGSYDFFCLDATNGQVRWADFSSRSSHKTEPKLFEDSTNSRNSVVYAIESLTGNVRQHNARFGQRNWEMNCADVYGVSPCYDSVEAEFSLSESGNVLYYGDIFGRIVALNVGEFDTEAPTTGPTPVPTQLPSSAPSKSMMPTSRGPTQPPTERPTDIVVDDVPVPVTEPVPPPVPESVAAPVIEPVAVPVTPPVRQPVPSPVFPPSAVTVIVRPTPNSNDAAGASNNLDNSPKSSNLPMILGGVAGAIVLLLIVFICARRLKRQKEQKALKNNSGVTFDETGGPDEESGSALHISPEHSQTSSPPRSPSSVAVFQPSYDQSLKAETGSKISPPPPPPPPGTKTKSRTPRKRGGRRKSKLDTPQSPGILEAIVEEAHVEEAHEEPVAASEETAIVLVGDAKYDVPKIDFTQDEIMGKSEMIEDNVENRQLVRSLVSEFSYAADIQQFAYAPKIDIEDDGNESVIELTCTDDDTVGDEQSGSILNLLQDPPSTPTPSNYDDYSLASSAASTPRNSPPRSQKSVGSKEKNQGAENGNADKESPKILPPTMVEVKDERPNGNEEEKKENDDDARSKCEEPPEIQRCSSALTVMSNDASLYMDETSLLSGLQTAQDEEQKDLSPLSAHMKTDDEEDISDAESSTGRGVCAPGAHYMAQPSLNHKPKSRRWVSRGLPSPYSSDDTRSDDSDAESVDTPPPPRPSSRAGSRFGQSVRKQRSAAGFQPVSHGRPGYASNKQPTGRRAMRNRREEREVAREDTWASLLSELEEAEETFFDGGSEEAETSSIDGPMDADPNAGLLGFDDMDRAESPMPHHYSS